MSALLSIRDVTKRFGKVVAVDGIRLDVAEGEFLTFLGPSGSGKSTLLYMVAGLEDVSEGDVLFKGVSLLSVPPNKRNIGMVFQRYTLIPHMNVRENIAFPLRVRNWPRQRIDDRVAEVLRLVRLESFGDRKPSQLSGGQQQRVALARALSYNPGLLLMDEPLAALDKKLKEDIQIEIRRIHRETGVTILYVTHDQDEALRLSDRIAVFNHGRIEQIATGAELYESPATRFVAGFVGNCNFLKVQIEATAGNRCTALFPDGTKVPGVRLHEPLARGEAGSILLRPDWISLGDGTLGQSTVSLAVVLSDMTYLGEILEISAHTSWGESLSARIPLRLRNAKNLEIGAPAVLQWPVEQGVVFKHMGPAG